MSLKEKIAAAVDLPSEKIAVPEWSCEILIMGMTAGGRSYWNQHVDRLNAKKGRNGDVVQVDSDFVMDYAIPLLFRSMRDPETQSFVFDNEDEAKEILGGKNLELLMPLVEKALRLSGIGPSADKEIKETFPDSRSNDLSSA